MGPKEMLHKNNEWMMRNDAEYTTVADAMQSALQKIHACLSTPNKAFPIHRGRSDLVLAVLQFARELRALRLQQSVCNACAYRR